MIRCLLFLCMTGTLAAQETRYAADPMLLGAGARPLGMGSAFVAVSDDATATYWNPAGLSQLNESELHAQHAEQFGGIVNHDILTIGFPTTFGAFGVGLTRVGVDGIRTTTVENPAEPLTPGNRPVASGEVGTTDYTLVAGFGREVRKGFSVGGSMKILWRDLVAGSGTGYGLDLGAHYTTEPWKFGLTIKDATQTRISFDSGAEDKTKQSLVIGAAYTRSIVALQGQLLMASSISLAGETSSIEDGQRIQVGAEYLHTRGMSARIGVDGRHFTVGAGIKPTERFHIDVAFLENGDLDNSYRISASMGF